MVEFVTEVHVGQFPCPVLFPASKWKSRWVRYTWFPRRSAQTRPAQHPTCYRWLVSLYHISGQLPTSYSAVGIPHILSAISTARDWVCAHTRYTRSRRKRWKWKKKIAQLCAYEKKQVLECKLRHGTKTQSEKSSSGLKMEQICWTGANSVTAMLP